MRRLALGAAFIVSMTAAMAADTSRGTLYAGNDHGSVARLDIGTHGYYLDADDVNKGKAMWKKIDDFKDDYGNSGKAGQALASDGNGKRKWIDLVAGTGAPPKTVELPSAVSTDAQLVYLDPMILLRIMVDQQEEIIELEQRIKKLEDRPVLELPKEMQSKPMPLPSGDDNTFLHVQPVTTY